MNIKNHEKPATPRSVELDVQSSDFTEKLQAAEIYAKKATVQAEFAHEGVPIETVLGDGTIETKNVTKEGDVIITNPAGEQYIVHQEEFFRSYAATDEEGIYRSTDMIRAVPNDTGKDIEIMAPWGEKMRGDADCYIVSPVDFDNPHQVSADRYIVGREEFEQTYGSIQDVLAGELESFLEDESKNLV